MIEEAPQGARINFIVEGRNLMGDDVRKTINIPIREGEGAPERLRALGLTLTPVGEDLTITGIAFGSYAKRIGLDVGYKVVAVQKKADQPPTAIPVALALALAALIAALQYLRLRNAGWRHPQKAQA